VLIALSLAGALALGGVVLVEGAGPERESQTPAGSFAGAVLPPGVRAPQVALRDQDGEPVSSRGPLGKVAVITFLYTHCRESCPAQAQQVRGALDDLGHDVPALAISVDPARDTAGSARAFLAKQRVTGRIDFVLGRQPELQRVWRGYAIQPQLPRAEHQARIVLVDRRGIQRVGFPGEQATPERIAHDLRLLESE
jgi:protein SCO1